MGNHSYAQVLFLSLERTAAHLSLELLVFLLLLTAVLFNLLLGLGLGFLYPLGTVCGSKNGQISSVRRAGIATSYIHGLDVVKRG